jgi:hypothetical protein
LHLAVGAVDRVVNLCGLRRRLGREPPDLPGDDRKTAAVLARARRLDRGVQRE